MISYQPLFDTLDEKGWTLKRLESELQATGGFSSLTTAKFRKGESVSAITLERICIILNVPIEQVIKIQDNEGNDLPLEENVMKWEIKEDRVFEDRDGRTRTVRSVNDNMVIYNIEGTDILREEDIREFMRALVSQVNS